MSFDGSNSEMEIDCTPPCFKISEANMAMENLLSAKSKVIKAETKLALSDSSSFVHLSLATVISIFSMFDITIDSELDLFEAAERYYLAHQELACVDIEKENNRAQSEETTTFRFTVNNFKNMKYGLLSPPCYLRGLPWAIKVTPNQGNDGKKKLGVFLYCNAENYTCEAKFQLRLINHMPVSPPFQRNAEHLFYSKSNNWGFPNFIAWDDVLDSNTDYIKNDSITLEALVIAGEPHISLSMKKLSEMKDMSIHTLIKQIRFLTLSLKELADYKPKSSLLTEQDILAIMMNLVSTKTYVPLPKNISKCKVPREPPE